MSAGRVADRARVSPRFTLPPNSDADSPPESRGIARDGVRLLVAEGDRSQNRLQHRRFRELGEALAPGDVLVVNTSATLAAALTGRYGDRTRAEIHVSTQVDTATWVIEPRLLDNTGPDLRHHAGEVIDLPGGVRLQLTAPYPAVRRSPGRLWTAKVVPGVPLTDYLAAHGRPIGYRYLRDQYPLSAYQNVYATHPGSAEMPSAGRPFTAELMIRLMAAGITIAPIVLHCGVSSPELHEPPAPERFSVPIDTARLITSARASGRRVIAVGTTVVRALESAVGSDGSVQAAAGWTDLVLGPERPAQVVDGLITGLHEPEASHLLLLESVARPDLVNAAYAAVTDGRYLWHEFGDAMLLLPSRSAH
jgi:S-adenosylmethionine:tRNA ribosyltransferase-isomerase